MKQLLLSILAGLIFSASVMGADNVLKEEHPDKYTVQEGDTLWDPAPPVAPALVCSPPTQ